MNNKYLIAGALLLAFAAGRYLTPTKIEIQTVEVEKKQTETDRDKHKETTTVTTEKPDGSKVTETKTTEDTSTTRSTNQTTDTTTHTTKTYTGIRTRVSGLVGIDVGGRNVAYGAAVSRNVLGPITAGAWGLTNGTIGVSLGLEF